MRISDWSSDVCSSDLSIIRPSASSRASVLPPASFSTTALPPPIGRDRRALRALQRRGRQLQPVEHAALGGRLPALARSEERRVGKGGGSTCRSRGVPCH